MDGARRRDGGRKALQPAAAVPEPRLGAVVLKGRWPLSNGPDAAEKNADVVGDIPNHACLRPRRGIAGKGAGAEEDCDDEDNCSFRGENAHP